MTACRGCGWRRRHSISCLEPVRPLSCRLVACVNALTIGLELCLSARDEPTAGWRADLKRRERVPPSEAGRMKSSHPALATYAYPPSIRDSHRPVCTLLHPKQEFQAGLPCKCLLPGIDVSEFDGERVTILLQYEVLPSSITTSTEYVRSTQYLVGFCFSFSGWWARVTSVSKHATRALTMRSPSFVVFCEPPFSLSWCCCWCKVR